MKFRITLLNFKQNLRKIQPTQPQLLWSAPERHVECKNGHCVLESTFTNLYRSRSIRSNKVKSHQNVYCAFRTFASFFSLRLFIASGLFSVSITLSHHLKELE